MISLEYKNIFLSVAYEISGKSYTNSFWLLNGEAIYIDACASIHWTDKLTLQTIPLLLVKQTSWIMFLVSFEKALKDLNGDF